MDDFIRAIDLPIELCGYKIYDSNPSDLPSEIFQYESARIYKNLDIISGKYRFVLKMSSLYNRGFCF